jgi:ATP-dependent DNA ligase
VQVALELKATTCVLDGEIVVPHGKTLSFDDLLQRIHPAASRVKRLSQETPALFIAFDLLATATDKKLAAQPLRQRRPALEAFLALALGLPPIGGGNPTCFRDPPEGGWREVGRQFFLSAPHY